MWRHGDPHMNEPARTTVPGPISPWPMWSSPSPARSMRSTWPIAVRHRGRPPGDLVFLPALRGQPANCIFDSAPGGLCGIRLADRGPEAPGGGHPAPVRGGGGGGDQPAGRVPTVAGMSRSPLHWYVCETVAVLSLIHISEPTRPY